MVKVFHSDDNNDDNNDYAGANDTKVMTCLDLFSSRTYKLKVEIFI